MSHLSVSRRCEILRFLLNVARGISNFDGGRDVPHLLQISRCRVNGLPLLVNRACARPPHLASRDVNFTASIVKFCLSRNRPASPSLLLRVETVSQSCMAASREQTRVVTTLISLLDFAAPARRVASSRVASGCQAPRRILTAANSAKSLGTNSLSAAQHRRWNPRRNFRFRRGSRALAEPKDDRSASEIVRDNSPPLRLSLLFLFHPSRVISLYLSRICLFSLASPSFSTAEVYLFVFPSTLASDTPASLCND